MQNGDLKSLRTFRWVRFFFFSFFLGRFIEKNCFELFLRRRSNSFNAFPVIVDVEIPIDRWNDAQRKKNVVRFFFFFFSIKFSRRNYSGHGDTRNRKIRGVRSAHRSTTRKRKIATLPARIKFYHRRAGFTTRWAERSLSVLCSACIVFSFFFFFSLSSFPSDRRIRVWQLDKSGVILEAASGLFLITFRIV